MAIAGPRYQVYVMTVIHEGIQAGRPVQYWLKRAGIGAAGQLALCLAFLQSRSRYELEQVRRVQSLRQRWTC